MTNFEKQILETLILFGIAIVIKLLVRKSVRQLLRKIDFEIKQHQLTQRIVNLFLSLFVLTALAGIWNIEREQLLVFLTSVITVVGIGFFAQWSILSNITASLLLFFYHPMKIGQRIHVLDKEYNVEGELTDISFFFMYIKNDEGHLITIPTSVALQKTIVTK